MSKYRGAYEERVAAAFAKRRIEFAYELEVLEFFEENKRKYKPDFVFHDKDGHKIYVETKGYFDVKARKKMLMVKAQHPDKDIRIIFQNAKNCLVSKRKRGINAKGELMNSMTYGEWCDKHGFIWADADTTSQIGNVIRKWYDGK